MKEFNTLLATALFTLAMLVFGILDMLDNPVIMGLMIGSYLGIIGKIIMAKSREDLAQKKPA